MGLKAARGLVERVDFLIHFLSPVSLFRFSCSCFRFGFSSLPFLLLYRSSEILPAVYLELLNRSVPLVPRDAPVAAISGEPLVQVRRARAAVVGHGAPPPSPLSPGGNGALLGEFS